MTEFSRKVGVNLGTFPGQSNEMIDPCANASDLHIDGNFRCTLEHHYFWSNREMDTYRRDD